MIARLAKHPFLFIEFLALCIVIPGIIIGFRLAPFMFTFLWGASLYGFIILRLFYWESFKHLWKWEAVTWENMRFILLRFAGAAAFMALFILWYDPERFLYVVRERPSLIPYLMVFYPLFSALPQEFVFCSFFFKRYAPFFGDGGVRMVLASAIVFAYAHVLYINPVAPALGFIAGLIFAMTYSKTRSLALVTIEHGIYGNFLFLIGLGWYFYSGSVVQ